MKVIANRQIHGVYGDQNANQEFTVADYLGLELLKLKLVRLPNDDTYAVKAIQPVAREVVIEAPEPRIANKRK